MWYLNFGVQRNKTQLIKETPTQNSKSPSDIEILIQFKNRVFFSWSSQQTVGQGEMSFLTQNHKKNTILKFSQKIMIFQNLSAFFFLFFLTAFEKIFVIMTILVCGFIYPTADV